MADAVRRGRRVGKGRPVVISRESCRSAGPVVVTVQGRQRQSDGLNLPQNLLPSVNGPIPPVGPADAAGPAVAIPPRYALPEESGRSVVLGRDPVTYDIDLRP
jgi:hypothetical protein